LFVISGHLPSAFTQWHSHGVCQSAKTGLA
jgi:hypothetical protein